MIFLKFSKQAMIKLNRRSTSKEALENEQKKTARIAQVSEKNRQADERAYLKQSVEMKIELALMYLNRSTAHLQYL